MKKKILFSLIFLCIVFITCSCGKNNNTEIEEPSYRIDASSFMLLSNYVPNKETATNEKVKERVLIIEIDPILTKGKIEGRSCKGKNASVCLGQNKKQAVNELIEDLKYSSHNYLNVEIVKTEKLNEFPTYKTKVKLLNGKTSNRLDESTWLDIMKNGWYSGIYDKRVENIKAYSYDYDYLIEKFNLVERRNNNEFDEVWLVNIDPMKDYESMMVGKNAFFVNGLPVEADCKPFKIMNVSISRPDANYECFGHATEQLLDTVFDKANWYNYNALDWTKNSTTITSKNYSNLSDWQKFMLHENQNTKKNTGLSGVGNMHYSPNGKTDYDWENTKKVKSKYREWANYPYITDDPTDKTFTSSAYMNADIKGTISAARLHHRWWFKLLPHSTGYSEKGYSNNWWTYIYNNIYVDSITNEEYYYKYKVNDKIDDIYFILNYSDDSTERIKMVYDNNVEIENKSIFSIDDNKELYALQKGESNLTYYKDGSYTYVNIVIE